MRSFSLAFLLGVLLLQNFSFLPDKKWAIGIMIFYIVAKIAFHKKWHYLRLPAACACGFAWCVWYANAHLAWTLPSELEGKTIAISGYIASIPNVSPYRTTFLFATKTSLIHLSWQEKNVHLKEGDEWRLFVRLKKIHAMLNPGGSDYEAWAAQAGVRASGYVVKTPDNKLLDSAPYHFPLGRIRQFFLTKIHENLPVSNTSPWIPALAVGERQGISQDNWEVLRKTGTNHLMAIAGLHIGFMAAFSYALVFFFWRRVPRLMLLLPAQEASAITSLVIAFTYSALAGFSVPTQRACIMLSAFLITALLRRYSLAWQAWSLALLGVLLINPLSVLTESFWLSFMSVALIIFGVSGRLAPQGIWWKWGRIQWVLTLGLVPLTIAFFQECSLVSFIANSISIPWVGFLIVPLTLLGCASLLFSAKIGGLFLWLADKNLDVLWKILMLLSKLSWSSWHHHFPSFWILLIACIGVFLLLLPVGFPGRWLGVIWLLPIFFIKPLGPAAGDIWLTLLDVGQGLSAVIKTQKHTLVFDAGSRWDEAADMGENVVLPFLRTFDTKKIDMLVISHGDNDHIGGMNALHKQLAILAIKTSVPEKIPYQQVSYCLRGETWQWDGVKFEFDYPTENNLHLGNNSSCVLRISNNNTAILLTGDIEKLAEKELINKPEKNLSADILVAPHHGSKTSALSEFIDEVNPRIVLFPIGYRNRYHFPHVSVVKKYQQRNVLLLDTVKLGAIQFYIKNSDKKSALVPISYRKNHLHYWNQ